MIAENILICWEQKHLKPYKLNRMQLTHYKYCLLTITMDECLMKILFFIVVLQLINTLINVLHKLQYLQGPSAHVAMAILSMMILGGYSGILNTIFLNRKFTVGRIAYIAGAILGQASILILSILAWVKIITYFLAIAIIHGLLGLIVALNFVCAVHVVHQQKLELNKLSDERKKKEYDKALAILNKYYEVHKKEEVLDDQNYKVIMQALVLALETSQNQQKQPLLHDL